LDTARMVAGGCPATSSEFPRYRGLITLSVSPRPIQEPPDPLQMTPDLRPTTRARPLEMSARVMSHGSLVVGHESSVSRPA
jgi:hypothetical protein